MLNELHIENIAVIERADISFGRGLNVLTGETGAGKSIVIDSIGAVLGDRVSRELVRRGADKGLVTAAFDMDGCEQWLTDNEIEADDELIIQRRITADGKLKPCLHSDAEITLRGLSGEELEQAIRRGILMKPERHHMDETGVTETHRGMFAIGG